MAKKKTATKKTGIAPLILEAAQLNSDLLPCGRVKIQADGHTLTVGEDLYPFERVGLLQIFTEHIGMNTSRSWLTIYDAENRQQALVRVQAPEDVLVGFRDALADMIIKHEATCDVEED